jgi:hypothetical protein
MIATFSNQFMIYIPSASKPYYSRNITPSYASCDEDYGSQMFCERPAKQPNKGSFSKPNQVIANQHPATTRPRQSKQFQDHSIKFSICE